MLYEEFINSIINTRGQWNIEKGEYWEGHHIIPVCWGGDGNSKKKDKNIIRLYPEEHFLAHKLLYEENPNDEKIAWAYICMSVVSDSKGQKRVISELEYKELSELRSQLRKGKKHTEETKKKISKNKQKNYKKENHPFYNKHLSEEHKKHISESQPRKCGSDNPFYGKSHSEETKRIIGEKSKGRVHSEKTKCKMSKAHKGKNRSETSKQKESITVKKLWENPEYRQKHIEGMKGKTRTVTKVKCPICNRDISKSNIQSHLTTHENGNYDKKINQYHLDHDDLFCKFCGKECKNKHSLVAHERVCKYRK